MTDTALLDGRAIVITGAATGIGQAFALACAAHGANVVVADINSVDETVAEVEGAGGRALPVRVDVADDTSARAMASDAMKAFGRIDGLITNAAYFREVTVFFAVIGNSNDRDGFAGDYGAHHALLCTRRFPDHEQKARYWWEFDWCVCLCR